MEVQVKTYNCPSRGSTGVCKPASWGSVYAMGDYAGVMVEWGNQWQTNQPPDPNEPNTFMGIIVKGGHYRTDNPSPTVKYGTVSPASVSDGLSNTIAIMEKSVNAKFLNPDGGASGTGGSCPAGRHNSDWPNMRLIGNWMPLVNDTQDRAAAGIGWWVQKAAARRPVRVRLGPPGGGQRPVRGRVGQANQTSINGCGSMGWSDASASCTTWATGPTGGRSATTDRAAGPGSGGRGGSPGPPGPAPIPTTTKVEHIYAGVRMRPRPSSGWPPSWPGWPGAAGTGRPRRWPA